MRSLRNRLIILFLLLFVLSGAGTLYWIQRTLADDLLSALDSRLTDQGKAVATWLAKARHVDQLSPRLGDVTGTRITIIGADGLVEADSKEPATVGRPIGNAWEVSRAHHGEIGRAVRELRVDEERQYLVAVPGDGGRVIRLAVPLGDIIEARARMRNRLLVGFGLGLLGALLLAWIFVGASTRPIRALTHTAEQLAVGKYELAPQPAADTGGGEIGVLARAMTHMAGEVKARIGELTQQRDLLSVVFAELVEGVVVVDRNGKITLANEAAGPLVGDAGELPPALSSIVARALAGEPDHKDEELELAGRTVHASARLLAARSDTAAAIVVLYDVTRMRALEAVRRDFLSNAAHELRTPVTSISGYAETLLGGGVDVETAKEFLVTIHRNAQRIAGLVSDLLVLDQLTSRAESVGARAATGLAEVVRDAVRTTKGVEPDAQIDVDVPADLDVLATREGLDHVVQNLIDNAVKYGAGTPVKIRAARADKHVRLEVSDAGPGIPEGHEDRIFERFYRVDAGRSRDLGGSGLGLAIVKSQVEAMGGRVWVEHAHPGARFVVELDTAISAAS